MPSHAILRLFFRRRWRGFEPLYRLWGSPRIHARTRHGVRFALNPHDYVDGVVLRDGFYETEVFEACRDFFTPGAIFWDIGGCFGLHAVTAKMLYPQLSVHVFEPNPEGQKAIKANARLNSVAIDLWPLALHDEDGTSDLFLPMPGNSGMASLYPLSETRYTHSERVVTMKAGTLIDSGKIPSPTVIKLDVEGSEAAVLRGFGSHLTSPSLRAIILECAPSILLPEAGDPLRALLIQAGFELHSLSRQENTAHGLINIAARRPA